MSLSPSDIVQWVRYAYEVKERLDEVGHKYYTQFSILTFHPTSQHRESSLKLYRAASALIDELDELEKLRQGHIADSMPGLDQEIASLRWCVYISRADDLA